MSQKKLHAEPRIPLFPTTTALYQSNGKDIKVHAISTGSISVKKNFMIRKGPGPISKLNILLGKEYTSYLPIWVFVIEHPEGIMVIDTGDVAEADHDEFYKKEGLTNKMNLYAMANQRMISRDDELDIQLAALNIKVTDVSQVVLTHLHGDHIDGVKFFTSNEIIVNELESKSPYGYLPTTVPGWFKPTLVNYSKNRVDYFDQAYPITKAEDVLLVSTPGHTKQHSSVLLKTDHEHILFAGDLTYQNYQLEKFEMSAAHQDYGLSLKSMKNALAYSRKYPFVYLPSHDFDSGKRLLNKTTMITNTP
jgi:N-acyl homoserine lactone hydrolase